MLVLMRLVVYVMQSIIEDICLNGKSEADYVRELNESYANWIYDKLQCAEYRDRLTGKVKNYDLVKIKKASKFYNSETFRHSVKEIVLGFIHEHNVEVDGAIFRYWQPDFYADCSFSSIGKKMGPNLAARRKTVINASDLHISVDMNWMVGGPRLMPRGGETYELEMGDIAKCIADNMVQVKHMHNNLLYYFDDRDNDEMYDEEFIQSLGGFIEGGRGRNADALFEFKHNLNIDRGTFVNPDNVRNVLLYFVKIHLGMQQDEFQYSNDYGVHFDFRYYYILVSQELLHLYLRAQNAHLWNWRHADGMFVAGAFQAVVKAYQYKYDINKTPDVISENVTHPYEVYKHCKILHNDEDFKLIQEEVITYMRHSGINLKHPEASYYLSQLDAKLNGRQLYDDTDRHLNAKGVVGKLLGWLFDHLTPRSIARFESV